MTTLEDELRAALHARAQALRVPERPELDHEIVEPGATGGPRWLVAAACLALIAAGLIALVVRAGGDPEPAPPVATIVPDSTTPAAPVTTIVADTTEPTPPDTPSQTPITSTTAPTTPPPELDDSPALPDVPADTHAFLSGFLDARVAGAGAEQYLSPSDSDMPLLYSTTTGAPYERAEFEPVSGFEWPYGWTAFTVRLFAGDTVVEQLLFTTGAPPTEIAYQPNGFGTHIAPTTENGQPVAMPFSLFDGAATMQVGHPWILSGEGTYGRLIPEGSAVAPTTDGGERNTWDELFVMADPAPVGACGTGRSATDAEAVADSIRADSALGATTPISVNVGGAEGVVMDVAIAAGTTICAPTDGQGAQLTSSILYPVFDQYAALSTDNINGIVRGRATGELMRLYLFDAPKDSPIRVLTFAIVAPEQSFDRAVHEATPIIATLKFDNA